MNHTPAPWDISMKLIESIETDKASMEIYECLCGYHMGVDATYIDQVAPLHGECPACNRPYRIGETE